MSSMFSDLAIRISQADSDTLREIYQKEIQAPIWTDEEREALLEAHGLRASFHNRIAVGMQTPRW